MANKTPASDQTRAVNMATDDVRGMIDSLDKGNAGFMDKPRAGGDSQMALIRQSKMAMQLVAEGHPLATAARVARLEADKRKAGMP